MFYLHGVLFPSLIDSVHAFLPYNRSKTVRGGQLERNWRRGLHQGAWTRNYLRSFLRCSLFHGSYDQHRLSDSDLFYSYYIAIPSHSIWFHSDLMRQLFHDFPSCIYIFLLFGTVCASHRWKTRSQHCERYWGRICLILCRTFLVVVPTCELVIDGSWIGRIWCLKLHRYC